MKAKLKVAYKNAKIARQRNREKAREAARAAAEAARTNPETAIVGGSSTIDNAGKTALGLQLKKLSLDAIGEEGEEEEVEFSDEEPEEYEVIM